MSKTPSRAICPAIYVMKKRVILLAHKTCHPVILEFFLKYKAMKEVVSDIDVSTTCPTQEITRQNQFQMRFLDMFFLLKNIYVSG